MGIHIGAVVTYQDGFDELGYDNLGRAFDNRIGGFMIAEVARLLKEIKKSLPLQFVCCQCTQEEIGLRGAEMIARRIKPDIAIVTDVTYDTSTPAINKAIKGDANRQRPSLAYAPAIPQQTVCVFVEDVADKKRFRCNGAHSAGVPAPIPILCITLVMMDVLPGSSFHSAALYAHNGRNDS